MKALLLIILSFVVSLGVIGNAYYQKKQFYPSVVYITKSNPSIAAMYVQGFVLVILLGKLCRKIFFGQLRAAESEQLIERSWYAVTETCLAFTVFRDDLTPKFVALFTLLLFLKCFHWLAEDRVDFMERSPNIPLIFHLRVSSLLLLLASLDFLFVRMAYYSTMTKGASVQLVFGFEYAILSTVVFNIVIKYGLHFFDLRRDNPWENKAVYLLYTELLMSKLKVILYLVFIVIMMKIHTFPLFAIRPMYLACKALRKAFNDVILSRRAILNMNTLYPDATDQDLSSNDNVCIICREEMRGNGSAKKLPCNHIFHISCLRSWFQRQQTCPTCRMDVLRPGMSGPAQPARPVGQAAPAQPQQPNQPIQLQQVQQLLLPQFHLIMANFAQLMQQHQRQQNQQVQQNQQNQQNQQTQQNQANQQSGRTQPQFTFVNQAGYDPRPVGVVASQNATLPRTNETNVRFMFPSPTPLPTINLQNLSMEDLHRMEGTEREAVEARIKFLSNIKTVLDSAILQFQQYNMIIASSKSDHSISNQQQNTASASTSVSNSASTSTSTFNPTTSASSDLTPTTTASSSTPLQQTQN